MLPRLFLIGAGLVVSVLGYQEYELRSQATDAPQHVELADLEAGNVPENLHLEIGEHWKLWDEIIYSYRLKEGEKEGPKTPIDYAFYPVISDGHPHSQAWDHPPAGYADWSEVPEERLPVLQNFAVLVRTERFKRVSALPEDGRWTFDEKLTGMVVNDVRSLDRQERSLLAGSYPALRLDRVLIFEENRKPESWAYCLGMMGLGAFLILLALGSMVRSMTGRKKESAVELPPVIDSAEAVR